MYIYLAVSTLVFLALSYYEYKYLYINARFVCVAYFRITGAYESKY